MIDLTYCKALENAEHLKAIGHTKVHLFRDNLPYDKVSRVEAGGGYRLNGPSGVMLIAEVDGITFSQSVDFEKRDANGKGYYDFDRSRLRDLMTRLPVKARRSFAHFLQMEVLPAVRQRTAEFRETMNKQIDSEEAVLGLIAFANEADEPVQ